MTDDSGAAKDICRCACVCQTNAHPTSSTSAGTNARHPSPSAGLRMLSLGDLSDPLEPAADPREGAENRKRDEKEQPSLRDVHEPFAVRRADVVHEKSGEKYPNAV